MDSNVSNILCALLFGGIVIAQYIRTLVEEFRGTNLKHDQFIDTNEFTNLYSKSNSEPAFCWDAVHKREKNVRTRLLAVRDGCTGSFSIIDFLRLEVGVEENILDGSETQRYRDVRQHRHVSVEGHRNGYSPYDEYAMMGEGPITTAADRGEYAKITAQDVKQKLQNGVISFTYNETDFRLYVFTFQRGFDPEEQMFILAWTPPLLHDDEQDNKQGERLVADVYRWASKLRKEMWIYNGVSGGWRKDKNLYTSVHASQSSELILPEQTAEQLERDTLTFFQSESIFRANGLAWKRGILLLGPPGNGKTAMIKSLANQLSEKHNIPSLYVETAVTRDGAELGISAVFSKARKEAPCLLILEDIETLVSGETRTMMLNHLDGLESNDGILIIASANKAEQLDPAIVQRPSRFDAKYHFDLPNEHLRARFCTHWLDVRIGSGNLLFDHPFYTTQAQIVDHLVDQTSGWSFAFLKELFVSVLLSEASAAASNGGASTAQEQNSKKSVKVSTILSQLELLQVQVQVAQMADAAASTESLI